MTMYKEVGGISADCSTMVARMGVMLKMYKDAVKTADSLKDYKRPDYPSDWPPVQSVVKIEYNHDVGDMQYAIYVRPEGIHALALAGVDSIREDAKANVRWALDRDLITESVAADFLSHFDATTTTG